jgi:RNA polymerase sigma factor (sigma-70 family)
MTTDPIQAWLNAAGRYPLLPASEILRLAKKRDSLTPGSKEYVKVINKISEHNLRLVPGVVRKYLAKRSGYSMRSEVTNDLLQQGYIGLRRAAEKFDAARGFTFATYAYTWIFQSVTRWHNCSDKMIYVPENAMTEVLYRRRHGRPSNSKNGRIGLEALTAAARTLDIASLDRKINHEENTPFSELIGEENLLYNNEPVDDQRGVRMLSELMAECNIAPRSQDVVLSYARRGRMSIVACKLKLSPKHCQNLYQEAVRVMKIAIKNKEADILNNNTTSTRN